MASSSSSSYFSGAVEHAAWIGALAFSNIGLCGDAIRNHWKNHRARLVKLVVELLKAKPLLGVLLNEVGTW